MIYFGDVLYKDHPTALNINWEVTGLCPYRCKYCDITSKRKKTTLEQITNFCINIKKIYNSDVFYQLCLTGGEPTTRSDFSELLNMYNDVFINNRIVLLTNMFCTEKMLEKKYISIKEKNKIILVGSLHLDSVKDPNTFFNKALLLKQYDFLDVEYKIIVPSWNIQKAKEAVTILETKYPELIPNIRIVRNFHEQFTLPEEFQKYTSLDKIIIYNNNDNIEILSYNDIKDRKLNNLKNYTCMLGKQNLYISSEGDVFGGLPSNECKQIPAFGNINNTGIYDILADFIKKDNIICSQNICNRECLMTIPKYII